MPREKYDRLRTVTELPWFFAILKTREKAPNVLLRAKIKRTVGLLSGIGEEGVCFLDMKRISLVVIVFWLFPTGRAQERWDSYITALQMPCYPRMARLARVQGTAKIKLVKSADGSVKSAEAVEGSPLLTKAAN